MRYSGGRVKYGYYIVNGLYTIKEEEAQIIRLIYDLYTTQNYGYNKTWKELNERGCKITYNQVTNILADTSYIGRSQEGKTTYDRIYPLIISEEQFDRAQKIKAIKK